MPHFSSFVRKPYICSLYAVTLAFMSIKLKFQFQVLIFLLLIWDSHTIPWFVNFLQFSYLSLFSGFFDQRSLSTLSEEEVFENNLTQFFTKSIFAVPTTKDTLHEAAKMQGRELLPLIIWRELLARSSCVCIDGNMKKYLKFLVRQRYYLSSRILNRERLSHRR